MLGSAPASSRERLRTLAGRIADVTQADESAVAQALRAVVDATDAKETERLAADLSLEGDPDDEATWTLLDEAHATVSATTRGLYLARRDALAGFLVAVTEPPVDRLHREVPSAPWLISPLLADAPREVLRLDDQLAAVRFGALPPVFPGMTIVCWAVGAEPLASAVDPLDPDLQIASAWDSPSARAITWQELLHESAEAHAALITRLEERR